MIKILKFLYKDGELDEIKFALFMYGGMTFFVILLAVLIVTNI